MNEKWQLSSKEFALYFKELKDIQSEFFAFEVTMSLAIITALGWFLTSSTAHKLIVENDYSKRVFLSVILLIAITVFFLDFKVWRNTNHVFELLKSHDVPVQYFEFRKISTEIMIVFYLFHVLLLGVLGIVISKMKGSSSDQEMS